MSTVNEYSELVEQMAILTKKYKQADIDRTALKQALDEYTERYNNDADKKHYFATNRRQNLKIQRL